MNVNINFDDFIYHFYSNNKNNEIVLEINMKNSDANIYDIHNMLLDLLIKGYDKLNTLDLHFLIILI